MSKSSPIDGTVILADEQYAGRGQTGNVWLSEPNLNLTFSVIYQTAFLRATEQFYLNMAVSLGIWSVVNAQLMLLTVDNQPSTVKIKWPNDIFVNDRKIAGILIENTISGMNLKNSVIGIGLNVNQVNFPEGIKATSLKNEIYSVADRNELLNLLLSLIEGYFLQLKERKFEYIKNEYVKKLYRKEESSNYRTKDGENFTGKIIDVDESGKLKISMENEIRYFNFKEVEYL
jgi:BirA family transcriptional regulator, biotin operon repressor / biotin---[acetyl-CoA-carboxylase] ligase